MNKLSLKILYVLLLVSTISEAKQGPPQPYATPPPGEVPVDSNIILLFIVLFLFGTFKIYKKQKTSI